jgi:hypothetical protein
LLGLSESGKPAAMADDSFFGPRMGRNGNAHDKFKEILQRLHVAVSQHWPDKNGRPKKIDPGVVRIIHVSIFGFSRGATQARAFTNWLIELARLDAHVRGKAGVMTLGGFPIQIDFQCSIPLPRSERKHIRQQPVGRLLNGHSSWADSGLRIPAGAPCVHLVAAREARRSFPTDSSLSVIMQDG